MSTRCKRKKAFLGAAISAASNLAAATMQVIATNKAAKQQSDAIMQNAESTAKALEEQNKNANELQTQMINSQTNMNKENNDLMRDIQATLQMTAGNEQKTYRDLSNKIIAKNGVGISIKNFNKPFEVTDGGGVIPINVDNNGYGLYEIFGNDHEHYHKSNGKYKSGVGIKFNNGQVIEGEGNQNTSKGEKLLVTPNEAMFISKHSIKGFNPSKAVDYGMNPKDAFVIQETIKQKNGIMNTNKAKQGTYTNLYGNKNPYTNYTGAALTSIGNIGGALLNGIGGIYSGNKLANAQLKAGNIMSDAYKNLKTFDMDYLNDYLNDSSSHAMAVVRSANTNINPQLERIRRNTETEINSANNNIMSSAARQNFLMKINDIGYQRASELYANKLNADEAIKRENAKQISEASMMNAQIDSQKNERNLAVIEDALKYNTDIKNESILGSAQHIADAIVNSQNTKSQSHINATNALSEAIAASGNAFGTAYDTGQKLKFDTYNVLLGQDQDKLVNGLIVLNDKAGAKSVYNSLLGSENPKDIEALNRLSSVFGFKNNTNAGNATNNTASNTSSNTNTSYEAKRYPWMNMYGLRWLKNQKKQLKTNIQNMVSNAAYDAVYDRYPELKDRTEQMNNIPLDYLRYPASSYWLNPKNRYTNATLQFYK